MGLRMFWLSLVGIFIVFLMDEGDRVLSAAGGRVCNLCKFFDGYKCQGGMKQCWKISLVVNKSCTTESFYFYDRKPGRYLFRYTMLSCKPCDEGMFQVYHDLLRETSCCTKKDKCNDGKQSPDFTVIPFTDIKDPP